jgi:DNA repair/transcription protein MET18/MMS19
LSKFLCSKLEDHYTIAPAAIPGLKELIRNENLDDENLLMIIRAILKDIHVQSLIQSDRHEIYSICYYMLTNRVNIIKSFKYDTDFVYGFIQAMDSEKDPRNLVLCFEIIPLICQNLTLGPFVDELFEVFSCYFPIDFTPVSLSIKHKI